MDDLSHHLRGKTIRGTTTNELVRLLREAEYGDGLHPDFDDHFYDALERDLNAKDTVWESLHHVLLAKVQPLRRKRSCRVLPITLDKQNEPGSNWMKQRQRKNSRVVKQDRLVGQQAGLASPGGDLLGFTSRPWSAVENKTKNLMLESRGEARFGFPTSMKGSDRSEGATPPQEVVGERDTTESVTERDLGKVALQWQRPRLLPASPPRLPRRVMFMDDSTATATIVDTQIIYDGLRPNTEGTCSKTGLYGRSKPGVLAAPLTTDEQRPMSLGSGTDRKQQHISSIDRFDGTGSVTPRGFEAQVNTHGTRNILGGAFAPIRPKAIKLGTGLRVWADETVAIERLVDQDSRHLASRTKAVTRKERGIQHLLQQEIVETIEKLPLGLQEERQGYLTMAQNKALRRAKQILENIPTRALRHAWKRLRQNVEIHQTAKIAYGISLATALVRGHLVRARVAKMRRAAEETEHSDHKHDALRRQIVMVSAASRLIISCLVAYSASRRQARRRARRAAAVKVVRYITFHRTRKRELRKLLQPKKELHAAELIQRWTRGVLVRQRALLDRRLRRIDIMDARFAIRDEVVLAYLIEHGAGVVIQRWWRTLPWRLRHLRYVLSKRGSVIQRAWRGYLRRNKSKERKPLKPTSAVTSELFLSVPRGAVRERWETGTSTDSSMGLVGGLASTKLALSDRGERALLDKSGATGVLSDLVSLASTTSSNIVPEVGIGVESGHGIFSDVSQSSKAVTGKFPSRWRLSVTGSLQGVADSFSRAGAGAMMRARSTLRMMASTLQLLKRRRRTDAAIKIQGVLMMNLANKMLFQKNKAKKHLAAKKLQTFVRTMNHNTIISRRHELFKIVCREAMNRLTEQGNAGLIITSLCRPYMERKKYKIMRAYVVKFEALVRGWLGRRQAEQRRFYIQRLGEDRATGAVRWIQLYRKREQEELLKGARLGDLGTNLELQQIFLRYCRFGDRQNDGRMRLTKLTSLFKDAGLVDKRRFPVQRVELTFSKLKSKELNHLLYPEFLVALDDLAMQHPDVCKMANSAAGLALEERVANITREVPPESHRETGPATHLGLSSGVRPRVSSRTHPVITPPARAPTTNYQRLARSPEKNRKRCPGNSPRDFSEHRSQTRSKTRESPPSRRAGKQAGSPKNVKNVNTHVAGRTATGAEAEAGAGMLFEAVAESDSRPAEFDLVGFRPDDQRLLILLQSYILVNSEAGKKVCSEMEAEGVGAGQRAFGRIEAAAVLIQAALARGCAGRSLAREAQKQRDIQRELARSLSAVTLLQTRVRGFLARTRVSKLAALRYFRCFDEQIGAEFYFDPKTASAQSTLLETQKSAKERLMRKTSLNQTMRCRTLGLHIGESSWTKPKILGKFELGSAVVVPPEEEMLVLMCKECNQDLATKDRPILYAATIEGVDVIMFERQTALEQQPQKQGDGMLEGICVDCDEDMLCTLCDNRMHRAGSLRTHLRVTIHMCDECRFQVAIKLCEQCGDNFCASCFGYIHRRGRLRRHKFEPLVALCHQCGERAQAVRCFGCHPEGLLLLCKPCQRFKHGNIPINETTMHRVEALGLRSMEVQCLKAERSARAEKMRMKTESMIMAQKEVDTRRQEKAIKIQTAWRGYLARKRRKHLISRNSSWRVQRVRDDEVRERKIYKLRRWLGNAPLLTSDTDQELVLKQYPGWWETTIVDIIKPGIGWHEGAKMVREQIFFSNNSRRRGRWTILEGRLRLINARWLLRRMEWKQLGREAFYARAVEAYRDVRAEGGIGIQHKKALQQLSRKAKRAVKNIEKERRKVEEMANEAENALEALVGPFRLRKIVRTALRDGMLMPFALSVNRGEATARLEKIQGISEVLQWMPKGRCVRIDPPSGGECASLPLPPSCSTGPFVVRGVKDGNGREIIREDEVEVAGDASTLISFLGFRKRGASVDETHETVGATMGQYSTHMASKIARAPVGGHGGSHGRESAEKRSLPYSTTTWTTPLLLLNRQWLLPSASHCRVYAMPLLPFPRKVAMIVMTASRYSPPVESLNKAAVVAAHALGGALERCQAEFDDDSRIYEVLGRWRVASEAISKSMMLRRRALFDINKGFDSRTRVLDTISSVVAAWNSIQEMAKHTKFTAMKRDESMVLMVGVPDQEVVFKLFKKWVRSNDKDKVTIMYRSQRQESEAVVEFVGHIWIDLDTPTPVLREFIRRFCGAWLNNHAKGERFLMEDSRGILIRRSEEGGRTTATAMQMVQERFNKETRNTDDTIFVQTEANSDNPEVADETLLIPQNDLLDPDSITFDDDSDGKKNKVTAAI